MIKTLNSFLLSLGLLGFAVSNIANEGTIAFVGATIIDGTTAPPLENGVLVITDGPVSYTHLTLPTILRV